MKAPEVRMVNADLAVVDDDSDPESEGSEFDRNLDKMGGIRLSDEQLRNGAIRQPISDVNFKCSPRCEHNRECAKQPGYLPFLVELRQRFWGASTSAAPTSRERMAKINAELSKIHKGGSCFVFGFKVTRREKDEFVEICESSYFKALGTGKTSQWMRAMAALKDGKGAVKGKGRPKFKGAKVRAYINLFLAQCDMPPSKGMQHIKILPFPNVRQFYDEYLSTFKAPYLAILPEDEATRYCILYLHRICSQLCPRRSCAKSQASFGVFRDAFNADYLDKKARFMRCKSNHTSCEVCINVNMLLRDPSRQWPPAADDIIKEWRHLHLKQQWRERRCRHSRRARKSGDGCQDWAASQLLHLRRFCEQLGWRHTPRLY